MVALKPSVGLVSSDGVLPVAKSQDAAGPITRRWPTRPPASTALTGKQLRRWRTTALTGKKRRRHRLHARSPYPAASPRVTGARRDDRDQDGRHAVAEHAEHHQPRRSRRTSTPTSRGTSGGAGSLQGIVNYNTANPVEGLKYQQGQLAGALSPDLSALAADTAAGKAANAARDRRAARRHRRDHGPEPATRSSTSPTAPATRC